jgi:flagellar biosynthesis/type III secretory pathway M-ring protein FliF/YscJ
MIENFVIRVDGEVVKYKTGIQTPNFKLLKNMKKEETQLDENGNPIPHVAEIPLDPLEIELEALRKMAHEHPNVMAGVIKSWVNE